jgi:hypothetical protein
MHFRSFRLHPVAPERLTDLVSLVSEAEVTLRMALPERTVQLGPWKKRLPGGHWAELQLRVERGRILRNEVRGVVDPPVGLPMGLKLAGLALSDRGDVLAKVSGLPPVNLTRLAAGVPRIPGTTEELRQVLLDLRAKPSGPGSNGAAAPATSDPSYASHGPAPEEAASLELRLQSLKPVVGGRLELGDAGVVALGEETCLHLESSGTCVSVGGVLHVVEGSLWGPELEAEGLRGRVQIGLERNGTHRRTRLEFGTVELRRFRVGEDPAPGWTLDGAQLGIHALEFVQSEGAWKSSGGLELRGRGGIRVPEDPRWARWEVHRPATAQQHLRLRFDPEG